LRIEKLEKKFKKKKPQEPSSSSSSDGESDASSNEDKEFTKMLKKRKKGDKKSNNSTFNYDILPSNSTCFMSLPIGKPPRFNGTNYTQWRHNMKMHLVSFNPGIWEVVYTCIEFPEEDESPTYELLQKIHRNAEAATVAMSSLDVKPPKINIYLFLTDFS
jgi:hypothetical protein